MGLTERHWFENEDVPENYEWALEDAVSIQDRAYKQGYQKGYSDGTEKQKPKQVIDIIEFAKGMKSGKCPSCGRSFVSLNADETKFCKSCGQEVKWE